MPHKSSNQIFDSEAQAKTEIDIRMSWMADRYPQVFQGKGKVKVKPIHIFLEDNNKKPVAEKLGPGALNLTEPLKNHLDDLIYGDMIEKIDDSEFAVG